MAASQSSARQAANQPRASSPRASIIVTADLHREAKAVAALAGESLSDFASDAIRVALSERRTASAKSKR